MASKNPRVNVVLPAELHEVLSETAELTGQSRSGLLRALVEAAAPSWARVNRMLRTVQKAQDTQLDGFREGFARAEADLLSMSDDVMSVLAEWEEASGVEPPSSNTGVPGFRKSPDLGPNEAPSSSTRARTPPSENDSEDANDDQS